MSKKINARVANYIEHKINILVERVYLAVLDKIFDAENYDNFDMDSDNNIYITYSLKKDESIIFDAHDLIKDQIKEKYRNNLEKKIENNGYFVEYDDDDILVYFEEPLKTDHKTSHTISTIEHVNEENILKFKKTDPKPIVGTIIDESNRYDLGDG